MNITKEAVNRISASGKDVIYWDDKEGRFGVRVTRAGIKSYVIQYRNAQGRSRRVTIGRHGTWTPLQARENAERLLRVVDLGGDPAETKEIERAAITVAQLCDEYIQAAEKGLLLSRSKKPKKASTLVQDKSRIKRHIKPHLGDKLVKDLTQAQVLRFYEKIATGLNEYAEKTGPRGLARVKGGIVPAKRCVGVLGAMIKFAVKRGYRDEGSNPAHGIEMPADERREFRLDLEGWHHLGLTLQRAEEEGVNWKAIAIARLLAVTGSRYDEIASLRWSEIDMAGKCLRFPTERVKSGRLRPIGQPAIAILQKLKAEADLNVVGSAFVFPSANSTGKPYVGFRKAWQTLGLSYSPHCLRHAFASAAEDDCGLHESTVGAIIGHSKKIGGVTRSYILKADATLLAAADKASRFVWDAMHEQVESAAIIRLSA